MSQVLLDAAHSYTAAGLSVLPIRPADKLPLHALLPTDERGRHVWEPFQQALPDDAWLARWFAKGEGTAREAGIAVICGRVSGRVEVLDFDHHPPEHPHVFDPWAEFIKSEAPGLFERLVIVATQHGGRHVWYRCPVIGGNQKLAQTPATDPQTGKPTRLTRIETRGEGGYAVVPPTPGYAFLQGALTDLPTLTAEERALLFSLGRSFQAVADDGAASRERARRATGHAGATARRRLQPANMPSEMAALLTAPWLDGRGASGGRSAPAPAGQGAGRQRHARLHPGQAVRLLHQRVPVRRRPRLRRLQHLRVAGARRGLARSRAGAGGPGLRRIDLRRSDDSSKRSEAGKSRSRRWTKARQQAVVRSPPPLPFERPASARSSANEVEAVLAAITAAADREVVEDLLPDLTQRCAVFERSALLKIDRLLRKRGLPQEQIRAWHAALNEVRASRRREAAEAPAAAPLLPSWPYEAADGRLWLLTLSRSPGGAAAVTRTPICDFVAYVNAEEVTQREPFDSAPEADDGGRWFHVSGETVGQQPFSLRLSAATLGDPRVLRTAFISQLGAVGVIYPKMEAHLGVALLKCAPEPPRVIRRYDRLGWTAQDGFLIPGCLPQATRLAVDAPYSLDPDADPARGQAALAGLLCSHDLRRTTVAAMAAFTPTLAHLAGWNRLRYALFIAGATGSLKTSWCMALMGVWGRAFTEGHGFTKFGERGASIEAVLGAAAVAGDLPLFIDNYKPQIAGARNQFIALVAALLEGDDKQRLERTGERLRRRRAITAWPLFTGEDVPGDDASTIARTLLVPFEWRASGPNRALTEAQEQAGHLSALGLAWVKWLASAEGQAAAWSVRSEHPRLRDEWLGKLVAFNPQMVNPARVASHLAVNQLTYWAVCQHPLLRPVCKPYENDHRAGLELIAAEMALRTQEASEGERFLAALRELVGRDSDDGLRYVLVRRRADGLPGIARERFLGWYDENGVYLLAGQARAAVEQARGREFLGGLSDQTLYAQLARQGCIASHEKGRHQQQIFVRGVKQRVLHLVTEALFPPAP